MSTAKTIALHKALGGGSGSGGGSGVEVIDLMLFETYEEEGGVAVLKDYLVMPEGKTIRDLAGAVFALENKAVVRLWYGEACLYVNVLRFKEGFN